jgi:hypothetical protein
MIVLPAVPSTPRLKVRRGMSTTDSSSLPCVVKSRPGSADSGGVPDAIVMVPPSLPPDAPVLAPVLVPEPPPAAAELLVFDDDELLPPQAARTLAANTASSTAAHGLTYLLTDPPPEVRVPRAHSLIPSERRCERVATTAPDA